jgi:hypothetical protein
LSTTVTAFAGEVCADELELEWPFPCGDTDAAGLSPASGRLHKRSAFLRHCAANPSVSGDPGADVSGRGSSDDGWSQFYGTVSAEIFGQNVERAHLSL